MQRIAQHIGLNELELVRTFQRARLLGNMKVLRLIQEVWGLEVMRDLTSQNASLEAGALAVKLASIQPKRRFG